MGRIPVRAVIVVLALALLVTFGAGCSQRTTTTSNPKPSPTVSSAPVKTTTLAPTAVPSARPTATPIAALKTLPTSEPVTFKEYAEYMAKQHAKLSVALRTVSTLSKQAADNPKLLTARGAWFMDMSDALSAVEIAANNIQKAGTVPPELKPLDDQAKSIGRDLENAASQLFDGIDKLDPALIKSATATFQSVNPRITEYNEDLKAFIETHP